MARTSKKDLILIHLQMYGAITSWEAINKFRATRLSAIIFDLKEDGHNITSSPITEEGANYVKYILHKQSEKGQYSLI